MPPQPHQVPEAVDDCTVVEFGAFPAPLMPAGYLPPDDGSAPLEPVKNVAICMAPGVDGFYTMFCTEDWRYVTYTFAEGIEYAKATVSREYGRDVDAWTKRA
ncbi:MAG: hypothetical protein V4675_25090 [Verrucomicrobiota bacterium]